MSARREAAEAGEAERGALAQLDALFADPTVGFAVWDADFRYVRVNRTLAAMNGRSAHEHLGRRVDEVLPDLAPVLIPHLRRVLATGQPVLEVEVGGRTAAQAGRDRTWVASYHPVRGPLEKPVGIAGVVREVTERREADERLHDGEQRFRLLVEAAPNGIVSVDGAGCIRMVNAQAETMFGYAREELLGQPVELLLPAHLCDRHVQDREAYRAHPTARPMGAGRDLCARRKDGTEFPVEVSLGPTETDDGLVVTAIVADITERKGLEAELLHQALYDTLTGLPNRRLFLDRLEHALQVAERTDAAVGVLIIDLDQFKDVNDSLGHEAGDVLLAALVPRLGATLRDSDTLARLGGDEFAVLCEGIQSPEGLLAVVRRLAGAWAEPVRLGARELFVTASTGAALAGESTPDAATLLRQADAAMYRAKEAGRGCHRLYDEQMRARAETRLRIENDLRRAVARDQLHLVYQPVVELADGRPIAVEALLRWTHPELGGVAPTDFIELAESSGLIAPIGRWVLEQACGKVAAWRSGPGCDSLAVYVNLSLCQLDDEGLVDHVAHTLAATGLPPAFLGLEITESVLIDDRSERLDRLRALRALGVRLLLDDFGTGYSSLSYLQRLPLDILKIDRAFVQALDNHEQPSAIVTAITTLADTLGLTVIAEGVETDHQVAELRRLGCQQAQGYRFARPLPPTEARRWIGAWPHRPPSAIRGCA